MTTTEAHREHAHGTRAAGGRLLVAGVGAIVVIALARIGTATLPAGILPDRLQDFVTLTVSVVVESMPFVVLGILLSIVVQVWLPAGFFAAWLPRNPMARRAVVSLLGVLLPVCECGNVPLARGLVAKGFSVSDSMTFLIAAPIVNPITIVTTYQAFGWSDGILVSRIVGGFLVANLLGWLYSKHRDQDALLTTAFARECRMPAGSHDGHSHSRVGSSAGLFRREMTTMLPALLVGAAVAGGVQTLVPRSVLLTLGSNPVWSILAMMALAFVISICSNVDAFFVLPFASTFLPGSIVAFLVFGPIVDIKMLTLLRTTYRPAVLAQIGVVVGLVAAVLGLVVNQIA
ncbi:permease [Frondihabitans sp. PhB188]|uniref:permease n=1 Tax=Frondihabitans sp. PhB188 TaxID=2485200 RepID=UPI000F4A445E|nr:permease [Frondihabitans sp. PhB188]